MNNKVKPALIGGVLLGVLSVIPFINWVNLCCCLWAILGGMLASYLYVKNSPTPASAGDGAIVGVFAGLIGGAIALLLGIPINLLLGGVMSQLMFRLVENVDPSQAEMVRERLLASQTVAGAIVNGVISAVFLFIFAVVGGLIGIPLFEKRKGSNTPPPPPNMG
jgi:hypothetical protein